MSASKQTNITPKRRSFIVGMAAVAVFGLVGGYVISGNVPSQSVGASSSWDNHWEDSWKYRDNAKAVPYVIEAVEAYLAQGTTEAGPLPDPSTSQVTKVSVTGEYAVGHLVSGDVKYIFFAHYADEKWTILYHGEDLTPEAMQSLQEKGFSKEWLDKHKND